MVVINHRIHLSIEECAERLGVAYTTVHTWLRKHQLPRLRLVGRVLVAEDDLTNFMNKKVDRRKRGWRTRYKEKSQPSQ